MSLLCTYTSRPRFLFFFFFNDTATTEIYTLSLHDALPISHARKPQRHPEDQDSDKDCRPGTGDRAPMRLQDRKSTRLNSSHLVISYAVFCLKKKKNQKTITVVPPAAVDIAPPTAHRIKKPR